MAGDVTITARLDGFTRVQQAIGTVSKELRRAGEIADRQRQRWDKFSQAAATAGRSLIGFGAAAAGSAGVAVKFAADWEESFANVRKTVDGTEAELSALGGQIQTLSRIIPISANELANLAGVAGQLGIQTKNIAEFTDTAAKLGVATDLSSEGAAVGLSRLANIAGTSQSDIDRLGSTIVRLGNNMATTESEILEMSLRLGAAGRQIGLAESETIAFAAALSSVGVNAEAGGTAFSRVFANMQSAVKSGGDEISGFAKVAGQSVSEFQRLFERDAAEAVVQFIEGLDRISQSGGNVFQVLDQVGLGEIRVRDALLRTSGATSELRKALSLGNAEWKANTALTDEASKRFNTFSSQVKLLRNDVVALAVSFGQTLFEPLTRVVGFFRRAINVVMGLPDPIKQVIAGITGLVGVLALVIGPLLLVVSTLPALWGAFTAGASLIVGSLIPAVLGAASAFAVFAVKAALIIGAAAAVAAGIHIVIENLDNLRNVLGAVGEWFKAFGRLVKNVLTGNIKQGFQQFLTDSLKAEQETRKAWDGLKNGVGDSVKGMVDTASDEISRFGEKAKAVLDRVKADFRMPTVQTGGGVDVPGIGGGADEKSPIEKAGEAAGLAQEKVSKLDKSMAMLGENMVGVSTAGAVMAAKLTDNLQQTAQISAETAAAAGAAIGKTFDQVSEGIGYATAQSIIFGENVGESFMNLIKNIGAQIIQAIVSVTIKRIAMMQLGLAAEKQVAAVSQLTQAKLAAIGAFSWTMRTIPVPLSFILAPVFAAAAFAGTMALGAFAGGVDEVPDTGSFVLHRGERVVQPKANRDLTEFLNRPESRMGGGGMAVNVTFEGPVITDGPGVNQIADMLARRIERQQRRRI